MPVYACVVLGSYTRAVFNSMVHAMPETMRKYVFPRFSVIYPLAVRGSSSHVDKYGYCGGKVGREHGFRCV